MAAAQAEPVAGVRALRTTPPATSWCSQPWCCSPPPHGPPCPLTAACSPRVGLADPGISLFDASLHVTMRHCALIQSGWGRVLIFRPPCQAPPATWPRSPPPRGPARARRLRRHRSTGKPLRLGGASATRSKGRGVKLGPRRRHLPRTNVLRPIPALPPIG